MSSTRNSNRPLSKPIIRTGKILKRVGCPARKYSGDETSRSRRRDALDPALSRQIPYPPGESVPQDRRCFMAGCAAFAITPAALESACASTTGQLDRWNRRPQRPGSRLDRLAPHIEPRIKMINANTGETVHERYFGTTGYEPNACKRLNWFMRDWREGISVPIDERLLWALAALGQAARKAGCTNSIRFLSGYRTEKTNSAIEGAAPNSMHLSARAVDFHIPGIPVEQLFEYCKWLEVGGTGHYPNRFVHIDTGTRREWTGAIGASS